MPGCPVNQEVDMMKTTHISLSRGLSIFALLVACMVMPPMPSHAQYADVAEAGDRFSREELAQLLAPIALYPDALLSQILMASTYPIEVVEADRWVRRNLQLQGDALDWALVELGWDPSVKALCHFPSILALMSERIADTADLGNAFLAQEADVMAMVQELRAAAYTQGNLTTTAQQTVIVERETIIIEPVNPRVVYVPYYDPFYVYGPWWYPAYPPYYWGPRGVSVIGISYWPGIYFSYSYSSWSTFDWHRRVIYVDAHKRPKYVHHDRWVSKPGPWKHNAEHRRGVAYRDADTAKKYGQPYSRSPEVRRDVRGKQERGSSPPNGTRRLEDRPWVNQTQPRDERSKLDRNRPAASQPSGQQREVRERSGRGDQEPVRVERNRQERERVQRQDVDRARQQQQLVERQRQEQQRQEQGRQLRQKVEQQPAEGSRGGQQWQRAGQEQQGRERAEGGQQPGRSIGSPNQGQAGNGYKTRANVQSNRQGAEADSRGSSRSAGESRSGGDQRGGSWR